MENVRVSFFLLAVIIFILLIRLKLRNYPKKRNNALMNFILALVFVSAFGALIKALLVSDPRFFYVLIFIIVGLIVYLGKRYA